MKKLLLSAMLLLGFEVANGGNDHVPLGARAAGLSHATVCLSDGWSLHNNVAGMAAVRIPEIGVYAENRFGMQAFSTGAAVGVLPVGQQSSAGLELYRFGDKLYNEQRLGLGYAHKIAQVSLGIKADLMQVHVAELGSRKTVALSFGGQSEVVPGLVVGAQVFNVNQAKLAEEQDERIPTVMTAGISYRPGTKVMLNLETEKDIELPANFKAGIEYQIIQKFALRTGFATLTQSASFGAGFTATKFQVDYAAGFQSRLGFSNHLSVSYKFE